MKLSSAVACLALAAPAHAQVWIVDETGAGDFLRIQPAVNAARDGDTIVVKAGSYPGFDVIDKALTITADLGASVLVEGSARVIDLAASRTVVFADLDCAGVSGQGLNEYGFYAEDCIGSVRVERCTFAGVDGTPTHPDGTDGARVWRCADVSFQSCISTGGRGYWAYWDDDPLGTDPRGFGGSGLLTLDSTVSVFRSTLEGGSGLPPTIACNICSGGHGGDGVRVYAPTVPASATTILGTTCSGGAGADGGGSDSFAPSFGGDGGHGVRVVSGLARLLDATATGGNEGWGWIDFGWTHARWADGSPGEARHGSASSFEDVTGTSRSLSALSPVREGDTLDLAFRGTPGERVTLLVALDARAQTWTPSWHAPRLVQAPGSQAKSIRPIGVIPASGTLNVSLPVLDLGYGVLARTLHLQALFRTSTGDVYASNAATPVELAASL